MKKYIYSIFSIFISISAWAQIPNSSFENWNTTNQTLPLGWRIYGSVTQVAPHTGTHAVRIERSVTNTSEPGAILYGNADEGNFMGGIPYPAKPDSLVAFFKYDIPAGDSAWVLMMFKNGGNFISQDLYHVYGSNTATFERKAFKINYTSGLTPDSLIIGFTSTNPDAGFTGGYVIVDDIHFVGGTTVPVPNGNLENWGVFTNEEPVSWTSSNIYFTGAPALPVNKSTDSYSGQYAAKIENINTPMGLQPGYLLAGPQGQAGLLPGFSVTFRDTVFSGYYKFTPQNNDTLTIGVVMFSAGIQVGWGFYQNDTAAPNYRVFNTPIYYDGMFSGTPDSATIAILPFVGGSDPHGASVLLVDDLAFGPSIATGIKNNVNTTMNMLVYPNPANEFTNICYTLEKQSKVIISIFDITGKLVETISNKEDSKGAHIVRYNTNNLMSGMYSIVIEANDERQMKKISIQK